MHKAKFMIINIDFVYPVGSIYFSINSTNPSKWFGGTWVAWGTGRVPVGVNTSDSSFNTVEKTGGAKTHTLTVDQIPAHNHAIYSQGGGVVTGRGWVAVAIDGKDTSQVLGDACFNTGGGQAHNNLQPYITCYMWKRTK